MKPMKKAPVLLLAALLLCLAACGGGQKEDGDGVPGSDWRTTGVVREAGTLTADGTDTDVLLCVHEDSAALYLDEEEQILYAQVDYPVTIADPWDTLQSADFADRDGDGDSDLALLFDGAEGQTLLVWYWDGAAGEFVYQPEESALPGTSDPAGALSADDLLAAGRSTWQSDDGSQLDLYMEQITYFYRTWYGRIGQGTLSALEDGRALLEYADGEYFLLREGDGFTLSSAGGYGDGELHGLHFEPSDNAMPEISLGTLDGLWQNALGETLLIRTGSMEYIACTPESLANGTMYDQGDGRGPYLFLNGYAYPRISYDGSSFTLYFIPSDTQSPDGSFSGVFYRDGAAEEYAQLDRAEFVEANGHMWYYDGVQYYAVPDGYTLAEDGRAYDEDGNVYAAGWATEPFDPADSFGDGWADNWGV